MKFNKWTVGLAALGVVSLTSAVRADESKMSQVQTALSNTTLSGYVDVSAQFNPDGGSGNPNYTYGSDSASKANGINLNVVDIALDKPLDESPWASGYHVEFWVGPDGNTLGVGNDIRQAYIALRTPVGNGIDWKVGVFDGIIGYEGTTSGNNPNYSHSFGYNLEPTTATGILGTYKVTDALSFQAGVANCGYLGGGGYTASYNTGMYQPQVMGSIALTAPDSWGWAKGATLSGGIINNSGSTAGVGAPASSGGASGGATSYYLGGVLPTPNSNLKFGASFDYLNARDNNPGPSAAGNAWALALYSTLQLSEKASLNLRAEYLDGMPLNGGAYGGTAAATAGVPRSNQAEEITATLQYNLWQNVLTRVELRWDHVAHADGYYSFNTSPTTANGYNNAVMLAVQAIYTF